MKILILQTTIADGNVVEAGKVYDIRDDEAKFLIMLGRAVEYNEKEESAEEQEKKIKKTTMKDVKSKR